MISGTGTIHIGETTHIATPRSEFFIPKETVHRIETQDHALRILEIAFGNFDENDIVRIKDNYNRT